MKPKGTVSEDPPPVLKPVANPQSQVLMKCRSKKEWEETLAEDIEEARGKDGGGMKAWMPTPCMIEIVKILNVLKWEANTPANRSKIRMSVRTVLDRHELQRTRIRCSREHNRRGGNLYLEIHRPVPGDDDYMKFSIEYDRNR